MNCFLHEDRAAVATCVRCGKGMCAECALFFDTPNGESQGQCPVCRRNDLSSEASSLEQVRNNLWIQAIVEKRKGRNRALSVIFFGILNLIIQLILEFKFNILIGEGTLFSVPAFTIPILNIQITGFDVLFKTVAAIVPLFICIIIAFFICRSAKKKSEQFNIQANAYEVSRYQIDKSLEKINMAVVKNRSSVRRL